jgi:hypothetical protein
MGGGAQGRQPLTRPAHGPAALVGEREEDVVAPARRRDTQDISSAVCFWITTGRITSTVLRVNGGPSHSNA